MTKLSYKTTTAHRSNVLKSGYRNVLSTEYGDAKCHIDNTTTLNSRNDNGTGPICVVSNLKSLQNYKIFVTIAIIIINCDSNNL